jgi:gamma-glutamylaminecyclotransferase
MIRLFALGTLKKGFPLHETALGGARCVGAYRTVQRYPMLVAGPWYAPMMLDQPGKGLHVRGELYEIDETRLKAIDAIESIGKSGNLRRAVEVEPLQGGPRVTAFVYMKTGDLAVPVHSGHLEDYQDRRFIPPWCRRSAS